MSEQKRERDTHTQGGREREREERKPPVRAYMCVWAVPLFSSRGGGRKQDGSTKTEQSEMELSPTSKSKQHRTSKTKQKQKLLEHL